MTQHLFETQRVARTEIFVNDKMNSRQNIDETHLAKLVQSIRAQGLLQPCVLIRSEQVPEIKTGKNFVLFAGFRRQKALDIIWAEDEIPSENQFTDYRIAPETWGISDALLANLTENLAREDLSSYELALRCSQLKTQYGMTPEDIAKRVKANDAEGEEGRKSLSKGHVNNLIRCVEQLHPAIISAWKERHPRASLRTLISIVAEKDEDLQLKVWKGIVDPDSDPDAATEKETSGEETEVKKKKVTAAQMLIAMERVKEMQKEGTKPSDWCKGVIVALKWCAGTVDSIPGVKLKKSAAEEAAIEKEIMKGKEKE